MKSQSLSEKVVGNFFMIIYKHEYMLNNSNIVLYLH